MEELPPTPSDPRLVTPTALGPYQVLARIARGGMAELFLGHATGPSGFRKLVAIKRILPHLADEREFVQMFLDEARIAATFEHPNLVHVFSIGEASGEYFFVMEYLHGKDLRQMAQEARERGLSLPLEHALLIATGVCAGLHYAHEKVGHDGKPLDLVHRDVSPPNVVVTFEGGIKLVDFGIAKAAARLGETSDGRIKGKAPYLSPEQCRCAPLDRRSDVFSVAVLLWELTTGARLFDAQNDFDAMWTIIETEARPPSQVVPGYPPELERIVLRGLHRDKRERYQTVQQLQLDLEAFAREHKLATSAIALAQFMRQLFGEPVEPWREVLSAGSLAKTASFDRAELPSLEGLYTAHRTEKPRGGRPWARPLPAIAAGALLAGLGSLGFWAARKPQPSAPVQVPSRSPSPALSPPLPSSSPFPISSAQTSARPSAPRSLNAAPARARHRAAKPHSPQPAPGAAEAPGAAPHVPATQDIDSPFLR